jgi:hypothetical protein
MGCHPGERFASVLCRWKMKATKGSVDTRLSGICTARPLDDVNSPKQDSSRVGAPCLFITRRALCCFAMIPSIQKLTGQICLNLSLSVSAS